MEALSAEVDKIVNSRYPTSLVYLNNVLYSTSQDLIEEWLYEHEDQLEPLASKLVENPSSSHFGISVVERLASHSTSFRDALLRQAPGFLHELLEKTNTSKTDLDAVIGACVAMLSTELPPAIALPAAAETLIQQLFRKTMIDMTVESVKPIYTMLSGGCRSLLDILPSSTVANFRIQLMQVMRKTTTSLDAQLLSSYCLAILAKLRTCDTTANSPDESAESSKFFSGDRALKTVHLLVLQVIYACKTEMKDSRSTTLAQINLAREVVLAVDNDVRDKWAKQNPQIIQKLLEKMAQESLAAAARLSALGFALAFCSAELLTLDVRASFATALLAVSEAALDLSKYTNLLHDTLHRFLPLMDHKAYQDILKNILGEMQSGPKASLRKKVNHVIILRELIAVTGDRSECKTAVARAISSSDIAPELEWFISHNGREKRYIDIQLASGICLWILSSLQETGVEDSSFSSVSHGLLLKMYTFSIREHKETSGTLQRGPLQSARAISQVSGIYNMETGWRGMLSRIMSANAEQHQHSLLDLIERTCQDFEQRCLNTEQPLREERSRRETAETDLTEAHQRNVGLEATCKGLESQLGILHEAKERLTSELSEVQQLASVHATESNRWKDQHSELEAEHALVMAETKQEFEQEVLQLKSQIACHTAAEHTLQRRIGELEESLQTQQQQYTQQESQIQELQAGKESMEVKLNDSNAALALERHASSEKDTALKQLQDTLAKLKSELAQAKEDTRVLQQNNTTLTTNLSNTEHAAQERQQQMQSEHTHHIHELETTSKAACQEYEAKIESLQQDLASAHASHEQTLAQLEHDLHSARTATLALEHQIQAKDIRLQESEKIKQQVLNLMGLQSLSSQPPRSAERRHKRHSSLQPANARPTTTTSTTGPNPRPHPRRSASDLAARMQLSPIAGRDEEHTVHTPSGSPVATAKFTSSGSPASRRGNRHREEQEGQSQSQEQSQSQASSILSLSLTSPARTPLAEASPNVKLRRPGPGLKRGAGGTDALRRRYMVLREGSGVAGASAGAGSGGIARSARSAKSGDFGRRGSRGGERVEREAEAGWRLPVLMTRDNAGDEYACNELDDETIEL